jgi:three-Cys-motif partner protein
LKKQFFDESTEQSKAKAAIVSKYFDAWARVISSKGYVDRIAYFDLFAGPGRYKDGTTSTPLLVLQKAIADDVLSQKLVAVFNDVDSTNTQSLEASINSLEGIDRLKYKPRVHNNEVGSEMVKQFETAKLVPSLFFVDPWGYKGLSLGLVNAVVKDWACECIFFFNYNRINMGVANDIVEEHMNALFGADRADELRRATQSLSPEQRELTIVEALCKALNPDGKRYILPFAFKSEAGTRTSHHLIFVSKSVRGYTIMKEIMASESSSSQQGVASFTYNPADSRQPVLCEYARPLDELGGMLLETFAGQSLTIQQVFERHNVGKGYVEKNYKDAVILLEESGKVTTTRTEAHRKRGQCPADKVTVTFLEVQGG